MSESAIFRESGISVGRRFADFLVAVLEIVQHYDSTAEQYHDSTTTVQRTIADNEESPHSTALREPHPPQPIALLGRFAPLRYSSTVRGKL